MYGYLDEQLLKEIIVPPERVLWTGRPSRLTYLRAGMPSLLFGVFWGMFDLMFLVAMIQTDSLHPAAVFFLFLHAIPFYIGVWGFIRRIFERKNVIYAFTDKKVIIREGLSGDLTSIDNSRILSFRVTINLIERLQGWGTIMLLKSFKDDSGDFPGGGEELVPLVGVVDPYQVHRKLQSILRDDLYKES